MAGQLGLDPPTMMLCSGGPTAELEQALLNSEAVANCFNSSIASAILFVIYCSASLMSSQRTEVQHKMEYLIGQRVPGLQHKRRFSDPIFLYILATDLPKGYAFLSYLVLLLRWNKFYFPFLISKLYHVVMCKNV